MTKNEYNGWFNHETWLANLWFDDCFTEDAQGAYDNARACSTFTRLENAAFALADSLQEAIEDHLLSDNDGNTQSSGGLKLDIMSAFLSECNCHEIAKHYIDEVDQGDEV